MNRYIRPYDPKAVRRHRRAIEGPAGEEPPELEPRAMARVMRCPNCRQTISTMRRWRMLCPECGHEWEEASNRTAADEFSDLRGAAGEYAVMGVMWTSLVLIAFAMPALFVTVVLRLPLTSIEGIVAFMVLAGGIGLFLLAMFRPHFETAARAAPWRRSRRDPP